MIYQTDFEKKKTLADGSTNFPDFMIRDFGCYFMCTQYLRHKDLQFYFTKERIIDRYLMYLKSKDIDYDSYVKNPLALIAANTVKAITVGEFIPNTYEAVIGRFRLDSMPAGLKSHFVVLDDSLNVVYDPIEGGSRHVREGELVDLRVFSS